MNPVEDHRDMASVLTQKRLEQRWRELCPFEIWKGGVNSIFVSYTYALLVITPAALVFKTNVENDEANQYGREVRSTGTTILLYPGHRVKEMESC